MLIITVTVPVGSVACCQCLPVRRQHPAVLKGHEALEGGSGFLALFPLPAVVRGTKVLVVLLVLQYKL